MKHQKHPIVSHFGPRPHVPSRRRPRKSIRSFHSIRMKKIQEEVRKAHAKLQYPSMMANDKHHNRNCNVKDQQGNDVLSKAKQLLREGGIVGEWNANAMKVKVPPMVTTPKLEKLTRSSAYQRNASNSLEILKMKQGSIHHSNDTKLSLRPKSLKAILGLVRNSKVHLNVDQGLATRMDSRDQITGCNDITNDENISMEQPLEEEKSKSHAENGTKGDNPTYGMMRKRRKYIDTNEDEGDNGDVILEGIIDANGSTRLASKDDMVEDCHTEVPMPFVVNCLEKPCYLCSKPIDEPVWSGLLKISDKEYIPLAGHLSTKSSENVYNLSKSLSRVVEVTKIPRSKVWPKRWEGSRPSNDNIGVYFFPIKMRSDKYHDQLLKEIMENDLSLRAILGDAEILMFPSSLLPERYQTFQMKHYLWGVFKPKEVGQENGDVLHHPCRGTTFVADATSTVSLGATGVATDDSSHHIEDATVPPKVPANHGQIGSSNLGASSGKMVAFVVRQTPRLEQLISEIEWEGSLVFQGEIMSAGPWLANMATTTQSGQSDKT